MTDYDAVLRKGLRLQFVPRWSIIPTINKQSVAEHSHRVGVTCLWLLDQADNIIIDRAEVLEYALRHDEWESVTGDSPAVAKHRGLVVDNTVNMKVQPATKAIVKLADVFETLRFLMDEEGMGNKSVDNVFDYVYSGLETFWDKHDWLVLTFKGLSLWDLWKRYLMNSHLHLHPGMRDE